ncbi:MAG: extracellular solute-binding protein [SAR324 cluster bacterium]|nr:extracellular solute-binding protein [SAR324 cluster bacterium]
MIKNAVGSNYIQPLTEISNFNRLKPSAKSAGMWDGKIYGVPMLGQYTAALYYHRKVIEKYGLTAPKTWEELISAFKTLKKNGETPLILPAQDGIVPYFTYSMIASSILKSDGFEDLKKGKIKLLLKN